MERKDIKKMWIADQGDGTYRNPILYTDYSDPDVIRVGTDYFMVASSFSNAPSVPLLHSKDLVNWKVINYVMRRLPFKSYDRPRHGCGAWAPAIRFHDGLYYVFVPFPDEGIMMVTARDPWGEWDEPVMIKRASGWIDPCPFWDDDGTMYMVNGFAKSRIGFKSALYLCPIRDDGKGLEAIVDEGMFVYDGHRTQPTIEGPKLYKRNGWYYIFAPAGGVKTGWQTVLRSRDIYGPYEERIVLRQGGTPVNAPHQGGWVDTPEGEDWFIHFQDVGSAGRIIHLQPMRWEDDWPVIGVNQDENGCGEPVLRYRKPRVEGACPIDAPEDSDLFDGTALGLQWQWNANYDESWYSLRDGSLTLRAVPQEEGTRLCDMPNLLLQKWPTPEFTVETCLHTEGLREGDGCGMISLGGLCDGLIAFRRGDGLELRQRTGLTKKGPETDDDLGVRIRGDVLYLKMTVEADAVRWTWSPDGEKWSPAGKPTAATAGVWVGVKVGLAAFHEGDGGSGEARADYFVFRPLD